MVVKEQAAAVEGFDMELEVEGGCFEAEKIWNKARDAALVLG